MSQKRKYSLVNILRDTGAKSEVRLCEPLAAGLKADRVRGFHATCGDRPCEAAEEEVAAARRPSAAGWECRPS